ncbi:hypothetical protein HPP92_013666 [Vanilla planifolia]|uniref:ATP-dependent RNA helicase Ski2/MTR4 C-terminal domain-containing protein n=1 Tax=Vanilla planifolia TaxID=51239 RepID=A0A835QNV3_VANPL|nr:hypothetical protein HPP92_013666 [Vanilla planifolia]
MESAFHLSYNMLLNQLRCEDGDPEKLLRHSFYQFQADRALPDLEIDNLSVIRVYMPKDLVPLEAREHMLKILSEVYSRFGNGIPLLDPEEDMKPSKMNSKARKKGFTKIRYITSEDVVKTKGKVACEITSADELTLTELMFSGAFKEISIEEMVALLSCFVWQERLQDARKPREELQLLFSQLQETARRVANVNLDCKVQVDVESFVNSFRFDIMEAVHAWTKGSKFFEIMEMSQVFEGSLIRAIRRLEEVLQQLALAAKSIGETDLEAKFVEAVAKIKRDIVFAASLYL